MAIWNCLIVFKPKWHYWRSMFSRFHMRSNTVADEATFKAKSTVGKILKKTKNDVVFVKCIHGLPTSPCTSRTSVDSLSFRFRRLLSISQAALPAPTDPLSAVKIWCGVNNLRSKVSTLITLRVHTFQMPSLISCHSFYNGFWYDSISVTFSWVASDAETDEVTQPPSMHDTSFYISASTLLSSFWRYNHLCVRVCNCLPYFPSKRDENEMGLTFLLLHYLVPFLTERNNLCSSDDAEKHRWTGSAKETFSISFYVVAAPPSAKTFICFLFRRNVQNAIFSPSQRYSESSSLEGKPVSFLRGMAATFLSSFFVEH